MANLQAAVFGGGCFWCTEAVFENLKGVVSVMPGYAGGQTANPTYEDVCTGNTGHAEVTKIDFDPAQVSYHDLLTVFFATHDPTTRNRQGNDVGTQYRSIILYSTPEQKTQADAFIKEVDTSSPEGNPVVTEVKPLETFYPAEEYHRHYFEKNKDAGYCQLIISPKVKKVQEKFSQLLKQQNAAKK
jgi:peptide-methionine (S)-S-oxide reductase